MKTTKCEHPMSFMNRLLKDVETGKLYINKRDHENLRKKFLTTGFDVKQPFDSEEHLIEEYMGAIDRHEFMLVYETMRIHEPHHDDPLDDLEWTGMSRSEYLVMRLLAKITYLDIVEESLTEWFVAEASEWYLDHKGNIRCDNEDLLLETDRVLSERIRITAKPVSKAE